MSLDVQSLTVVLFDVVTVLFALSLANVDEVILYFDIAALLISLFEVLAFEFVNISLDIVLSGQRNIIKVELIFNLTELLINLLSPLHPVSYYRIDICLLDEPVLLRQDYFLSSILYH